MINIDFSVNVFCRLKVCFTAMQTNFNLRVFVVGECVKCFPVWWERYQLFEPSRDEPFYFKQN